MGPGVGGTRPEPWQTGRLLPLPRVPHEGQPCGLASRQEVAACSDVPMVPLEAAAGVAAAPCSRWAAGHTVSAWELASLRAGSGARGGDAGHCRLHHGPAPWTPLRWRMRGEGSPQPRRPLQGDRRPVTVGSSLSTHHSPHMPHPPLRPPCFLGASAPLLLPASTPSCPYYLSWVPCLPRSQYRAL